MDSEETREHNRPTADETQRKAVGGRQKEKPKRTLLGALLRLPLVPIDMYLLLMLVYFIARIGTGNMWGPVELFGIVLPYVLLLTIPFFFVALAYRAWVRVGGMAILSALFMWWYGVMFLPQAPASCNSGCTEITILQYNTGTDTTREVQLLGLLQIADADIVAMEEVGPVPAGIMEDSGYPHQVFYDGRGLRDIGLYSRYPIVDYDLILDPDTQFPLAIQAILDVNGQPMRVIVAHPARPRRVGEFDYFVPARDDTPRLAALAAQGGPTILVGDLNTTDQSPEYASLRRAGLRDSWREAGTGLGASFPAAEERYRGLPVDALIRIDYVMHTSHFRASSAELGPDAGSDHLPLIVTLRWKQ